MPRSLLFLPIAVFVLSGCTISAKATPAIDSAAQASPQTTATVAVRALPPDEAVKERLQSVLGPEAVATVASVVADNGAVAITLAVAPSTLGGAEQYWSACRAVAPLLAQNTVTAVSVIAPNGRTIVAANVNAPACSLASS